MRLSAKWCRYSEMLDDTIFSVESKTLAARVPQSRHHAISVQHHVQALRELRTSVSQEGDI